jgi:hypothetical protein
MKYLIVAAVVAIAGCAATQKKPQDVKLTFDPGSHLPYLVAGNGEIRGRAILREADGMTCSGREVIATPATPYFRQVIGLVANGQMPLIGDAVGPEYASVVHTSVCDRDGNFSITGLPPGDWYVTSSVNWTQRNVTQGSLMVYKVRLRNREMVQIVMSERDVGIPR